jgi:DNA-binding response OmpR family regulator
MVVDDDAAIARLISLTLRGDGYAVQSARDGQDALSAVSSTPPDLIVLDLEMPVMNGRTFFRELRARGLDMPVLIVSAFGARDGQRELGAQDYLAKPFNPTDLLEKVRLLLA